MSRLYLFAFVLLVFLLPGCVFHKQNYLKKVPRITGSNAQSQAKDNVIVRTKVYGARDAKDYFGVDLAKKGYTPIQISIENNSNDMYIFRPSYLNVELASTEAVAQELYNNTSLKTSAIFTTGYFGFLYFHPLWPLMLVAPYYCWESYKKNQKITNRLPLNTIQEWQADMPIPPHTTFNKFAFTPTEYFNDAFTVGIFNADAKRYEQYHFVGKERYFALQVDVI